MNVTNDDFVELDMDIFNVLKDMFAERFPDAVASHNKSALNNINAIIAAIEKGDTVELMRAAHSLKGASGQFGAVLLSELARKMEMYSNSNELDKANEMVQDIIEARISVEALMLKEID